MAWRPPAGERACGLTPGTRARRGIARALRGWSHPRLRTSAILLGIALGLTGCGATDSAPPRRGIVFIGGPGGRGANVPVARGARAQARRIHEPLTVRGADGLSVGGQIAAVDAAIAAKPLAVLIAPVDRVALLAPTASMDRAGIAVVTLRTHGRGGDGVAEGVAAVRRVQAALSRRRSR